MKIIVVFICITSISFTQGNPFKLDSLILGEWELIGVEIISDYGDTNTIKLKKPNEQKLVITGDFIYIDKVYSSRYYQRREQPCFHYKIQYGGSINLYEGKKRKQKIVNSFEVLECNFETLIIRNINRLNKGLESASFHTIYTYKKKNNTSLSSESLKGEWFSCSDINLFSPIDSITYEFTRLDSTNSCLKSTSIELKTRNFSNEFSITDKIGNTAFFGSSANYSLDFENKLLYILLNKLTLAYSVDLENDRLLLKLNREVTEKINSN